MNPESLLEKVASSLEALVESSAPYGGLFPSMLDPQSGETLKEIPPRIEGQRVEDRAFQGSNLMHDEPTLATLYALSEALGRKELSEAADRYLKRFATHCACSSSSLFPWGEHSFWHLPGDRIGNGYVDSPEGAARFKAHHPTHDHLRAAPLWLWRKLGSFNPSCVERFADGLDWHWMEGKDEYNRHAHMQEPERYVKGKGRSCDFPRHSGFYIFDSAFAYSLFRKASLKEQIWKFLDYWWLKRDGRGLCLIESRAEEGDALGHHGSNAPLQTLSLAASLLEAAELLAAIEPELSAEMRRRAAAYVEGFLDAPHDARKGSFAILSKRSDNSLSRATPLWASVYSSTPASSCALLCLCCFRLTGDARLLRLASEAGEAYLNSGVPKASGIPAMDIGACLGLFAELHEISGEARWLNAGLDFACALASQLFAGRLIRGALGVSFYDSQMGPGFALHSMARLALMGSGSKTCPLKADFTMR